MDMKSRLSAAVIAAILAGVGSEVILGQFLDEKEGNRLSAYQDAGGVWTVCRGITRVKGAPVRRGMTLTAQQCNALNRMEAQRAIDWVKRHVRIPLTEPQIAGIASFCPYNIGPGKCFSSTFYRKLNAGDKKGACAEIQRWIFDGGRDCRQTQGQANGCYGQVERRAQESALTCWGLDE
ncbi:putative Qin prophage; lysozyme [Xenorhabdus bovienii str. oregonense]|uniref:Lysozyme n=1 Tax=Xenorhabdus bovienii str. oregonense TaxID=1398202 RepID=A0A077P2I9_XENBV|nr:lysozyme [Xenorhabdus bovienii]CDH05004.1 putative Qin prophage; lysozyme [Xenorhabdus bovienii str. oregonense]